MALITRLSEVTCHFWAAGSDEVAMSWPNAAAQKLADGHEAEVIVLCPSTGATRQRLGPLAGRTDDKTFPLSSVPTHSAVVGQDTSVATPDLAMLKERQAELPPVGLTEATSTSPDLWVTPTQDLALAQSSR
jgi:hypothetical protein